MPDTKREWEVEFGGRVIVEGIDRDDAEAAAISFIDDATGISNIRRITQISGPPPEADNA